MLGLKANEVSFCSCSSEAYNLLASALDVSTTQEMALVGA